MSTSVINSTSQSHQPKRSGTTSRIPMISENATRAISDGILKNFVFAIPITMIKLSRITRSNSSSIAQPHFALYSLIIFSISLYTVSISASVPIVMRRRFLMRSLGHQRT